VALVVSASGARAAAAGGTGVGEADEAEGEKEPGAGASASVNGGDSHDDSNSVPSEAELKAMLARKLMQDPNFQLPSGNEQLDGPAGGLQAVAKMVNVTARRALWQMIRQDFGEQRYDRFLALVGELAQRIKSLTPHRPDLQRDVDEALDVELIKQQIEHADGLADWDLNPFCSFVVERLKRLEAPAHNEATARWLDEFQGRAADSGADRVALLAQFFDYCHDKLDQIGIDTANAFLRGLVPVMHEHGAQFVQEQFREQIEKGKVTLTRTNAWASAASALAKERGLGPCSAAVVHRLGVVELVLPGGALAGPDLARPFADANGMDLLPETMAEERDLLREVHAELLKLERIALAVLRVKQVVPGAKPEALQAVYGILASDVAPFVLAPAEDGSGMRVLLLGEKAIGKAICDGVVNAVGKFHELTEVDAQALRDLLVKSFDKQPESDRTYQLVASRLRSIVRGLIVPAKEERTINAKGLGKALGALGVAPLSVPVVRVAARLLDFCTRDLQIHGGATYKFTVPSGSPSASPALGPRHPVAADPTPAESARSSSTSASSDSTAEHT